MIAWTPLATSSKLRRETLNHFSLCVGTWNQLSLDSPLSALHIAFCIQGIVNALFMYACVPYSFVESRLSSPLIFEITRTIFPKVFS